MDLYKYLVIRNDGRVRIEARQPQMSSSEVAVGLAICIPDEIFERPHLEASINITEEMAEPDQIKGENEGGIISKMDMDVKINVKSPKGSGKSDYEEFAEDLKNRIVKEVTGAIEQSDSTDGLLKRLKKAMN